MMVRRDTVLLCAPLLFLQVFSSFADSHIGSIWAWLGHGRGTR
jgi:hypothetical protein